MSRIAGIKDQTPLTYYEMYSHFTMQGLGLRKVLEIISVVSRQKSRNQYHLVSALHRSCSCYKARKSMACLLQRKGGDDR